MRRGCAGRTRFTQSLWARTPEENLLPTVRELGVGFVPWGPLGSGFLAGDVEAVGAEDFRSRQPRFEEGNLRENGERFAPLRELARDLSITPAQLALAWLLHRSDDIVPIPGMTQRWQVDENIAAVDIVLSDDVLPRIDELAPPGFAVGAELL